MVNVGMLCHPKKLVPPTQVVKFCGLLFDTRGVPCLRIPIAKRERASAIVEHLIHGPNQRWSRLSLAVAAGVLESLVETTPRRLGHTRLRRLHSLIHPENAGTGLEPYLSRCRLTEAIIDDLKWWLIFLDKSEGRYARGSESATLVPTWGDGSGTGTGGTLAVPKLHPWKNHCNTIPTSHPLTMWKGKWSPFVFGYTSNWKELETLALTLRYYVKMGITSIRGTTLFYFTDSATVYWIASSGSSRYPHLHALIEEIRMLELILGCHLEVIHVPGLVMILEGSDNLSRGIWMTSLHKIDPHAITKAVFEPVPYDPWLVAEYIELLPLRHHPDRQWFPQNWMHPWVFDNIVDRLTVWFPPPELARNALTFVLECWAERPLTTSALFFIPRVVPSQWRRLCKHFIELELVFPHKTSLRCPPALPIPFVVLYLPPHQRCCPTRDRLDRPPDPPAARWHRQQAELLRRLPPRSVQQPEGP